MHPASIAPHFQDSRTASAPRDLTPALGLLCAITVSATLWAVPIAAWLLLR